MSEDDETERPFPGAGPFNPPSPPWEQLTGEVTSIMSFETRKPELSSAVGEALGAVSVCWSDIEAAGVFDSTRAGRISEELLAYIHEETDGPESLVEKGDRVKLLVVPGLEMVGELKEVFSGAGETDGLIQIVLDDDPRPVNVYERHIILLQRVPGDRGVGDFSRQAVHVAKTIGDGCSVEVGGWTLRAEKLS